MSAEVPAARRAACHPPAPAATTTDQRMRATAIPVVERYRRPARWLHAGIYTTVLVLLATGWWLLAGHEGHPSPLARLTTMPDTSLHKLFGWALTGIAAVGVLFGVPAIPSFLSESMPTWLSGCGRRGSAPETRPIPTPNADHQASGRPRRAGASEIADSWSLGARWST